MNTAVLIQRDTSKNSRSAGAYRVSYSATTEELSELHQDGDCFNDTIFIVGVYANLKNAQEAVSKYIKAP